LAEAAAAARGYARHEHAVAELEGRDASALLDDGADGLVAQNRSGPDLGNVALEDVQIGAADRRGVDPDDDVRRRLDRRVRHLVPESLPGTVIHECFHQKPPCSLLPASRAGGAGASAPVRSRAAALPQSYFVAAVSSSCSAVS